VCEHTHTYILSPLTSWTCIIGTYTLLASNESVNFFSGKLIVLINKEAYLSYEIRKLSYCSINETGTFVLVIPIIFDHNDE